MPFETGAEHFDDKKVTFTSTNTNIFTRLFEGLVDVIVFPAEVALRQDFGERYFQATTLAATALLGLALPFVFNALFAAASGLYASAINTMSRVQATATLGTETPYLIRSNPWTIDTLIPFVYFTGFVLLVLHIPKIIERRLANQSLHSRYSGTPYLYSLLTTLKQGVRKLSSTISPKSVQGAVKRQVEQLVSSFDRTAEEYPLLPWLMLPVFPLIIVLSFFVGLLSGFAEISSTAFTSRYHFLFPTLFNIKRFYEPILLFLIAWKMPLLLDFLNRPSSVDTFTIRHFLFLSAAALLTKGVIETQRRRSRILDLSDAQFEAEVFNEMIRIDQQMDSKLGSATHAAPLLKAAAQPSLQYAFAALDSALTNLAGDKPAKQLTSAAKPTPAATPAYRPPQALPPRLHDKFNALDPDLQKIMGGQEPAKEQQPPPAPGGRTQQAPPTKKPAAPKPPTPKFQVQCPGCKKDLVVSTNLPQKDLTCPKCEQAFRFQNPSYEDPPEPPVGPWRE